MNKQNETGNAIANQDAPDAGRRNLLKMTGVGITTLGETAYAAAAAPKELHIVRRANHTDLYDRVDVIPFAKLTAFFRPHLA